ncbi:hypothetical protein CathTA2_1756 [Caldalkalibacillus thermarum TA2.A1]|uniref:Uncharacterized protein n=1 Tax=Caldalkalibacillus thermarum (strain TA2.A1) TaxID=986075 RepID=F5L7F6_CALTT|nr:hypothetical protein [Caldalkalibacillus thermarum]EGL82748.1 hypothetical protein CathTA2_1756 [Caldalkalibacillus thermarum TA2.A1]QZT32554.1 hypothetical protein HUR95_09055 [Caldalkalibacillus thermarum TA2.A1]
MKGNFKDVLLELGLSIAGLFLFIAGSIVNTLRRQKGLTSAQWMMGLAVLSVFLIGFGLLSLMGPEPFAVPVILIGIAGLVLSVSKLAYVFLKIGFILASTSLTRKS